MSREVPVPSSTTITLRQPVHGHRHERRCRVLSRCLVEPIHRSARQIPGHIKVSQHKCLGKLASFEIQIQEMTDFAVRTIAANQPAAAEFPEVSLEALKLSHHAVGLLDKSGQAPTVRHRSASPTQSLFKQPFGFKLCQRQRPIWQPCAEPPSPEPVRHR